MIIVGVDTETTGLSPTDNRVIEIGAVAWDVEFKTPVAFFHTFIKQPEPIPEFIRELTGLTDEVLNRYGISEDLAMSRLRDFCFDADYLMAQNAPFDKGMLDASFERQGMEILKQQWIDTVKDVPYPPRIKSKSLVALAAEHGFLNPFPHRAVTDVLTMLTVASKYDVKTIIEMACEPKVMLWAKTTYAEREKAKQAGFYFNGDKKMWFKSIFLKDLLEETEKCNIQGFEVQVIYEKSPDQA